MKKVIFVGLNEFNIDLLKDLSEIIPNKYLTKLNNLVHKKLLVKDEYSSGFSALVQWVASLQLPQIGIKLKTSVMFLT